MYACSAARSGCGALLRTDRSFYDSWPADRETEPVTSVRCPSHRSCWPAGVSRCRTRRCGSCARPDGHCRSSAPRADRHLLRGGPSAELTAEVTLQPVRRLASTPPSCSATSCARRRHRDRRGHPTGGRAGLRRAVPVRGRPRPAAPARARRRPAVVIEAVRLRGRARGAAHRVRRRARSRSPATCRGRPVARLRQDQSADARRPGLVEPACSNAWRRSRSPACGPRSKPAPPPCSCSTAGPARWPRTTTRRTCCPPRRAILDGPRRPRRAPHPLRRHHR